MNFPPESYTAHFKRDKTPTESYTSVANPDKNYSAAVVVKAITNGLYIVGNFCEVGGVGFTNNPRLHDSAEEARKECRRLADLKPGKMYFYVKLSGAEQVPVATRISI